MAKSKCLADEASAVALSGDGRSGVRCGPVDSLWASGGHFSGTGGGGG